MKRTPSPRTTIFLVALLLTALVWILRGLGILTFMPGAVLWVLILFLIASAIMSGLQKAR